jgi:hypothetical protein
MLILDSNPIQDKGAELIEEFLSGNKCIIVLSLRECGILKSKRLLRLSFPTTDILFN